MSENGITIAKLVEISDISETAIKNIREHRQEPLKTTTHLICKALDVEVRCLFPEFEVVGVSLKRKYLQQVG
jgi:transcriptional regulator with XRE-family HTH domain